VRNIFFEMSELVLLLSERYVQRLSPLSHNTGYFLTTPVTVTERSRHALSSLARKPGSWVQIPPRAWMFSVCVFLCLCTGRGLATS
jgi:hypothetical protein